jgi:hypothetical protein
MPTIAFEIRRDREQEMIHRGVQYSRAIRNYYKKFGRYPTRLEDLDNTNNLRYLRKHYKDPVTGQDFKLLHYGDPGLSMTGSIGGGGITGANSVSQMNGQAGSTSAFGGAGSAFSQSSSFGGNSNSAFGGGSSFGGGSNSAFGGGFGSSGSPGASGNNTTSSGTSSQSTGSDSSQSGNGSSDNSSSTPGSSSGQGNNQVFGGGPIVGVASVSKKDTIREFNHKHKYNEWQFIYDPTLDRGGLILTPNQPGLQIAGTPPSQIGQPAGSSSSGSSFGQSGFGQSSSFGQSSGFGNNNSGFTNGPSAPAQPPSSPPQ